MNETVPSEVAKIGFIGQGWIGNNYANDFENRGYCPVRFGLETQYSKNENKISECDIVFIAVPTPTTPEGFDDSVVREVIKLVGKGKIAVIKSTITPGTTLSIQQENPDIFVMHSPEFLVEKTAAYDAAHPNRNIIGIPYDTDVYRLKARTVMDVLPDAPYQRIMHSRDAELVKYAGNCFLFTKVLYMNILHDVIVGNGGQWKAVREAMIHDPRIGASHTQPVHQNGRGAGGHCFIKDFEAFRDMYTQTVGDKLGDEVLRTMAEKNISLLIKSGKDKDLLEGVYGKDIVDQIAKNVD
jgi:nucleotide sugar dehydrogenase